jgi:hypothetical protein
MHGRSHSLEGYSAHEGFDILIHSEIKGAMKIAPVIILVVGLAGCNGDSNEPDSLGITNVLAR